MRYRVHPRSVGCARESASYYVVGGVAVNLHAVPRMTYDVDLVVPTTVEALTAVDGLLTELGLRCRLPIKLADLADESLRVSYRDERNLIAVTWPAGTRTELSFELAPAKTKAAWAALRR